MSRFGPIISSPFKVTWIVLNEHLQQVAVTLFYVVDVEGQGGPMDRTERYRVCLDVVFSWPPCFRLGVALCSVTVFGEAPELLCSITERIQL